MALKIRSAAETEFDLLSLGECMIRLSPPGHQRIELTPVFEAYAGGGEYNVAYALARYGMRTGWISRLVDNPLGAFIKNHARASGMDVSEVIWVPYDGSGRADRIGLNFTEVGIGVRASVTMYDRGHTAVEHMKPSDVDWKRIFNRRKVRWFHTGGIFTAAAVSSAPNPESATTSYGPETQSTLVGRARRVAPGAHPEIRHGRFSRGRDRESQVGARNRKIPSFPA